MSGMRPLCFVTGRVLRRCGIRYRDKDAPDPRAYANKLIRQILLRASPCVSSRV